MLMGIRLGLYHLLYGVLKSTGTERLPYAIPDTYLAGTGNDIFISIAGNQYPFCLWRDPPDPSKEFQPVHARQPIIAYDNIKYLFLDYLHSLFCRLNGHDVEPLSFKEQG